MGEMRLEVGVKESSKMKLARSTRTGHVDKWQMKKWQREQMPRKWRGNGCEEDRNCDWDCIESDPERLGEECKKMIDRKNWRLLTEKVI